MSDTVTGATFGYPAEIRAQFPDEVVTHAFVRDIDLPYGAGTLALITLDNGFDHTKPSTFGPGSLLELNDAIDAVAARDDLVAVGVTGKPFIFAVGADLKGVGLLHDRGQALGIARLGHAVFRRLGELSVPTFAFVNGAAMGGGVEVALHCTYRTISAGVPAVALPECFLGLVPGWGGTYLLPRLIGPSKALKVIAENALSQNKMLRGRRHRAGHRGRHVRAGRLPGGVAAWAARVLNGEVTVERRRSPRLDAAIAAGRFFVDGKLHGRHPRRTGRWNWSPRPGTGPRRGFAAEDGRSPT